MIMITVNIHHDKCLCGSNHILGDCCLRPCGNLVPTRPITNYRHPDCYASESQDCSEAISREHYISRAVLQQLGDGRSVPIGGMPWQDPNISSEYLALTALQSKILCERHNHALSPLDNFAGRFFRVVSFVSLAKNGTNNVVKLFHGPDLERWLIKVICGGACSGNLRVRSGDMKAWKPDRNWLNILFRGAELKARRGLYYAPALERATGTSFSILAESTIPAGIAFCFHGIPFLLVIDEPLLPI